MKITLIKAIVGLKSCQLPGGYLFCGGGIPVYCVLQWLETKEVSRNISLGGLLDTYKLLKQTVYAIKLT